MAGACVTIAPRSVSVAASPLACGRARVTTMRRPASGRRSRHASSSRRPATGPTIVTAGAPTPASATRSAMSASVPVTTRWSAIVPRSTTATGSSALRPSSISRCAMRGSARMPM